MSSTSGYGSSDNILRSGTTRTSATSSAYSGAGVFTVELEQLAPPDIQNRQSEMTKKINSLIQRADTICKTDPEGYIELSNELVQVLKDLPKPETLQQEKNYMALYTKARHHFSLAQKIDLVKHCPSTPIVIKAILDIQYSCKAKFGGWSRNFKNVKMNEKNSSPEERDAFDVIIKRSREVIDEQIDRKDTAREQAINSVALLSGSGMLTHPHLLETNTKISQNFGQSVKLAIQHQSFLQDRKEPAKVTGEMLKGIASTTPLFGIGLLGMIPLVIFIVVAGFSTPGMMTQLMKDLKRDFVTSIGERSSGFALSELEAYAHLKGANKLVGASDDKIARSLGIKGEQVKALEKELNARRAEIGEIENDVRKAILTNRGLFLAACFLVVLTVVHFAG